MPVSNLASVRQFPEAVRPSLYAAYAAAREALIETHQVQAVQFAREFSQRLPVLDALDLYFLVVPVPMPMEEAIVSRALVALDVDQFSSPPEQPSLLGLLRTFRLDLVLDGIRQRRQAKETTYQLARLAGARAQDSVLETHVANAFAIAGILQDVVWVDEAVGHYIHTFRLPLPIAHMVYQRTRARFADRKLAALLGAQPAPVPMLVERRKELRLPGEVRIAG